MQSVGYRILFSPMISAWLLIAAPPQQQPGSSVQTSLVATTSQSVHFARSHTTRLKAGQPHLHTCLSARVSGGEMRVHTGRWHAGRSLTKLKHVADDKWLKQLCLDLLYIVLLIFLSYLYLSPHSFLLSSVPVVYWLWYIRQYRCAGSNLSGLTINSSDSVALNLKHLL